MISKKYPENRISNVRFSEVMQQRDRRDSRPDACDVVVEFAFTPDFTYFATDETQSLYRNEHTKFLL